MKLYHISQDEVYGYDTFSDAVVAAPDEETAKTIHPISNEINIPWPKDSCHYPPYDWTNDPAKVTAKYIGEAAPGIDQGVICSSFHAG